MNILITIYNSLGYGGAEVSTSLLARELEKFGHKIIMASSEPYPNLTTKVFKKFHKVPSYAYHERYFIKFLRNIIKQEKIDLVYPQDRLTSIIAVKAAKQENVPVIVHVRDFWYACPRSSCLSPDFENYDVATYKTIMKKYPKSRMLWDLYKWHYIKSNWKTVESADAKICSSHMEKEKMALCGIKSNVHVIPIARDVSMFENVHSTFREKYNLKKHVVGFSGTLSYTKGVPVLLKIIPKVIQMNKDISFLIMGDGAMMDDLKTMIKKEGIEDNVVLTGRLPLQEAVQGYAASDVILLPVLWREPFSGVPLEVGAMGKPLIASNIGAIREMTEDFKILVEPNDYDAWTKAIITLLQDEKLQQSLGQEGRRMVEEKYQVAHIAKKISQTLQHYAGTTSNEPKVA